jgi:hypothetical protein
VVTFLEVVPRKVTIVTESRAIMETTRRRANPPL